jgi:hypothetical protein
VPNEGWAVPKESNNSVKICSVSASSAIDRVRTMMTTVRPESMRIALGGVWGVRDCLDRTRAHVLSAKICNVEVQQAECAEQAC